MMLFNAGLAVKLRQILDQDELQFVFQPIVDIPQSTVLGYEALMRGPAGTPLECPDDLLRMAKACNLGSELEVAACKGAIQAFAGLHLPGKLFLNLSASSITAFGTPLVAEGVEVSEELAVLRDLGCHFGQGYLFARPAARPAAEIGACARTVLSSSKISVMPNSSPRPDIADTIGRLKVQAPTVCSSMSNADLAQLFTNSPELHAVAVVEKHYPVGLVNRRSFVDKFAQPYSRELYGRRPCTLFMNRGRGDDRFADPGLVWRRPTPPLRGLHHHRGRSLRRPCHGREPGACGD